MSLLVFKPSLCSLSPFRLLVLCHCFQAMSLTLDNRASIETLFSSSGGYRKPENLFESYEDLLQRKRAQERRYRLVHITLYF